MRGAPVCRPDAAHPTRWREHHEQHQFTTTRNERVEAAVAAVRKGRGVLVVDDEDRENEGDIIFSAASITHEQMALLIRECSGIVCLCLPEDKVRQLDLPQMVANNTCKNRTASPFH